MRRPLEKQLPRDLVRGGFRFSRARAAQAYLDLGIGVEQQVVSAAGGFHCLVAGGGEADILLVLDDSYCVAVAGLELFGAVVV